MQKKEAVGFGFRKLPYSRENDRTTERGRMRKDLIPKKCTPCGNYLCQIPMPIRGRRCDIDICISDLVAALNAANLVTTWSCCGHGETTGVIGLDDGRHLIIHSSAGEYGKWEYVKDCLRIKE